MQPPKPIDSLLLDMSTVQVKRPKSIGKAPPETAELKRERSKLSTSINGGRGPTRQQVAINDYYELLAKRKNVPVSDLFIKSPKSANNHLLDKHVFSCPVTLDTARLVETSIKQKNRMKSVLSSDFHKCEKMNARGASLEDMIERVATRVYGPKRDGDFLCGVSQRERFIEMATQLCNTVKYDERGKPYKLPLPEIKLTLDEIPSRNLEMIS